MAADPFPQANLRERDCRATGTRARVHVVALGRQGLLPPGGRSGSRRGNLRLRHVRVPGTTAPGDAGTPTALGWVRAWSTWCVGASPNGGDGDGPDEVGLDET
jgi:hypothetical protein